MNEREERGELLAVERASVLVVILQDRGPMRELHRLRRAVPDHALAAPGSEARAKDADDVAGGLVTEPSPVLLRRIGEPADELCDMPAA